MHQVAVQTGTVHLALFGRWAPRLLAEFSQLGRAIRRLKWFVLPAWLVLAVTGTVLASALSDVQRDDAAA